MEFKTLTIPELEKLIWDATTVLNEKKATRRAELHDELQRLGKPPVIKGDKKKLTAKYRSKANAALQWAGRGQAPTWLVEEMKATGLPREAFKA